MNKYEKYKPSGIDWIGEVPNHWNVKRLKNIVLNDIGGLWGDEPADDENDIIVLRVADFDRTNSRILNNPDFTYRNIRASQLDGRIIKQGDILLEKSGGGEQQPVGKAVLFDKDFKAVTSNFINKIETIPSVNNLFALYLFDALYYNNINVRNIKQTTGIQNLDNTGFFGENISLPPSAEQLTIANYLDHQTQLIDRLLANKKAQAEKLKELRQIEINNAVTKGLNPNAELIDSGIDWLGSINKEYKLDAFKRVCKLKQGLQIDQELRFFEIGLNRLPYITIKAINAGVDAENIEYIENADEGVICTPDEILLARTGATGEVVTGLHGVFHNNFFKIIYNRTLLNKEFLVFYLNNSALKSYLLLLAGTTTIPDLNHRAFFSAPIVLPDMKEQIKIANYLQERTSKIDKLIRNIDEQIGKLQDLRKIKIYKAVTGKIKVSAYAEATT
jgi:type I restriction enzyme S subunit